jgi:CcmD family protein
MEDKFFIVIVVMAIILVGIGIYLFSMERKVKRLEKKIEEQNQNAKE